MQKDGTAVIPLGSFWMDFCVVGRVEFEGPTALCRRRRLVSSRSYDICRAPCLYTRSCDTSSLSVVVSLNIKKLSWSRITHALSLEHDHSYSYS